MFPFATLPILRTYPRSVRFRRRRAEPDEMKGTSMTTATILESEETVSLIASDKVEGTAVYGTDQKKIGKLERAMIDKISGKVAYACLLYTSDAADDLTRVDLGGRRIIKKKK